MINRKLESLPLKGGIHTVSIVSDDIPTAFPESIANCVFNRAKNDQACGTKALTYRTKINPNEYRGAVISVSDFEDVMSHIAEDLGIKNYTITRVDYAIDDCSPGSFEKNFKINKLLVLLLGHKYKSSNQYESKDPITHDTLTIRIDTDGIQVEFYNKEIQSKGTSTTISRQEFRSKRLAKTKHSVMYELKFWCVRLRGLPDLLNAFTDICNRSLIQLWEEERSSKTVTSKKEFIRKYQDSIYTDQQLDSLCLLLGSTKAYGREVKYKVGIKTITTAELKDYISQITTIILDFCC